jgi:hypothetical protein
MLSNQEFHCRVCGLLMPEPPWGDDGKSPAYDFCPCCGVEFGYGDCTHLAAQSWRETWIKKGAVWDNKDEKPTNWNLEEQLKTIPAGFA